MAHALGIDLSSRSVDLVTIDEGTGRAAWTRVPLRGKTAFDRCRQVPLRMPNRGGAWYDDIYLAAIERPKTQSFTSAAALFPVFGAVLACLPPALEVWDVSPAEWRKELGLPGNAPKELAAAAVHTLLFEQPHGGFAYIDWPQDALDAYAVARYAQNVNARAITPA